MASTFWENLLSMDCNSLSTISTLFYWSMCLILCQHHVLIIIFLANFFQFNIIFHDKLYGHRDVSLCISSFPSPFFPPALLQSLSPIYHSSTVPLVTKFCITYLKSNCVMPPAMFFLLKTYLSVGSVYGSIPVEGCLFLACAN